MASQLHIYLRVLSVYALIIAVGSFYGHFISYEPGTTPFFAHKRNFLNVFFVKAGWAWFSLAFWLSVFARNPRRIVKSAFNYTLGTLYWLFFTQWLRGPPLMDRIFVHTGGFCQQNVTEAATHLSSSMCKQAGGQWVGGHDPSGHVFILVHTSMLLWTELLPSIHAKRHSLLELAAPCVLMGLWAVMLFTTSLYFHSFIEKTTGLFFGSFEVLFAVVFFKIGSFEADN